VESVIIGEMPKRSKPSSSIEPTAKEIQLLEVLRTHPELFERFETIVQLAEDSDCTADELEEALIDAVRSLGHLAMESWGRRLEAKTGQQFKESHSGAEQSKKKR
jgi:hypothetical protein